MRRPPNLPPSIQAEAVPLDDLLGVFEDGRPFEAVETIVERLKGTGIIVLGGGVVRWKDNGPNTPLTTGITTQRARIGWPKRLKATPRLLIT